MDKSVSRIHIAAAITGYVVWGLVVILVTIILYGLGMSLMAKGSPERVSPPFDRQQGMNSSHLLVDSVSKRMLQGDGATFQAWRLSGSPDKLRKTVKNEISNNRIWFHRPFDNRDRQALAFLTGTPEYARVARFADEIQSDDFYFAYDQLRVYGDDVVTDAGMWLFSPKKLLLVYMNGNT